MRVLLDTHVFHWYISADPQSPVAFREFTDRRRFRWQRILTRIPTKEHP